MATPREALLHQRLNPSTGQSEWVVIEEDVDEDGTAQDGTTQDVLAYTSYLDMLNDKERNRAYEMAIGKAVREPCLVLDIGAGTGLLSMIAARALEKFFAEPGREHAKVVACEAFLPMFLLACKVLKLNRMSSSVHLIHKRSDEMQVGSDISFQADLLVMEILDSEILGEGLIPTINHAHEHLLKPNASTVPYRVTLYGQLIECDHLWRFHDIGGIEALLTDGLILASHGSKKAIGVKPVQYPFHIDSLMNMSEVVSDPFEVFSFDFSKRLDDFGEVEIQIKTTRACAPDAVISWWVLQLDEEGMLSYSTAPKWIKQTGGIKHSGFSSWCNHWKQCVWFLPCRHLPMFPTEHIILRATHDTSCVRYDICSHMVPSGCQDRGCHNIGNCSLFVKPERIGTLGSERWRAIMITVVKKALKDRSSSLCLVLDDSLPLTVAATAYSNTSHVIAMMPGLQLDGLKFIQTVADANQFSANRVEVLSKKVCEISFSDLRGRKVDIVLAEPYYCGYEDMLPWQNLRFWNEITSLRKFISEKVVIVPCQGVLRGMAVSLPDLWKSRQSLVDVEGFDHSAVNIALGACGNLPPPLEGPILPCFLWQCGILEELTEPFSIMTFDFLKPIHSVTGSIKVPFLKSGICHAIVLWIDWVMEAAGDLIVSMGPLGYQPTYWKQGVKLLASPVSVESIYKENIGYAGQYAKSPSDIIHPCMLTLSALFDSCNIQLTVEAKCMKMPT